MTVTKCDWCDKEEEKKNMKYWHTGHLLCVDCFNKGKNKNEEIMKEMVREMRGRQGNLDIAKWQNTKE